MPEFGVGRVEIGDRSSLAIRYGDEALLLSDLVAGAPVDFEELFLDWDAWMDVIGRAVDGHPRDWRPASGFRWERPGVARPNVYCAGANYTDHVLEMGVDANVAPFHFVLTPEALAGPDATLSIPPGVAQLDWEVELACVIGRTVDAASPDVALDAVAGYTVANDISVRGAAIFHDIFGVDWILAKNRPGHTPVGPVIVPARFVADPEDLALELSVNGHTRQSSRTSMMITGVAAQIARLSNLVTLNPGDMILTGTPAGTAARYGTYLQPGDVMTARIEHLGELVTRVAR